MTPYHTWTVLFCLLHWLCSVRALANQPSESGLDESSVLLQGRVHIHDSHLPPLPRGGYERLAVHDILGAVDSYLEKYEATHRSNLAQATDTRILMNSYLTNLNSLVRYGEFEGSDTHRGGLNGSLHFNQELGLEVLKTLHSGKAVSSLERGIKNLHSIGTSYCLRIEKHISNLKALAAEAAQGEIPAHIDQFFKRQEFVTKNTLQSLSTAVKDVLAILPEDFHRFAGISEHILKRLAERSSSNLAMAHKKLMQSSGADFCTGLKQLSVGLNLKHPVLHQTLSMLPMLELLAQTQMPEVTAPVQKLSNLLQKHADNLSARLDQDARVMEETLCNIVSKTA